MACGRSRVDITPIQRHCQYRHSRQTLLERYKEGRPFVGCCREENLTTTTHSTLAR